MSAALETGTYCTEAQAARKHRLLALHTLLLTCTTDAAYRALRAEWAALTAPPAPKRRRSRSTR
jgi:hypothetical protein